PRDVVRRAVPRLRAREGQRPRRRARAGHRPRDPEVLDGRPSMARAFVLPDLGEGLTEAEIRQVLVREGDVVREDAPLLEVETDKATVEIPSPMAGRVERIHVQPGQTVKVGQVLVEFGDAGAPAGKQAADTLDPTRTLAPGPSAKPAPAPARPAAPAVAKPLARVGVEPPPLPKFEQWGPVERQPLSHLRRTIAERMTLSATLIPHVTHFDRADITELDA